MSKALATKNVAALLLSVAMVFGVTFAFAAPARAQTLESLQAQIQALLAQIAALQGGSTTTPGAACTTFTRNHQQGDTGGEVMAIQKFLNSHGAQVAASGAGSPGNETSYFGGLTRAAVSKFQAANGISPTAGYWGPITRAKANSMCAGTPVTPGVPGVPVTGNGLKVMLASDSPVNVALVQGQAIGELAKFVFSNPTGSTITVTNLGFKRVGVSNDSTMTNVYLYEGAARLTDSAGVSNSAFNFNDTAGVFTVAPGQSRTISVRSDIAGSTSGQQVGVQLASVAASGALDTSVVLPITGGIQTVSAATLATADFNTTTLPSTSAVAPQNEYVVWQNTVTISTRAVWLQSFQLRNVGSIKNEDIRNLKLFIDGVQVGSTIAQLSNGEASVYWDLSGTPKRLETGGRVIKVVGDIVGGSSLTFQFSLRRAGDARLVDSDLNQPILATANGSTFTARAATSATIDSGTVSVVKATNSPTSNVTLGASNVKWASYEFRAAGEDVKVESLNVNVNTSSDRGLDNGKVFLNGVQVGSTKDLTDATDVEFTFGSSFILKAGETAVVDIYADAKSTTGAAFTTSETALVTLDDGSSNGQGQVSLTSINVPGSDTDANTLTISSSSLSASKASGYGNQTLPAGTNNAKLGSFVISAGSTEGLNVNTIALNLSAAEAATITDLRLVDASTGQQIGTTKATPSGSASAEGDNSFSVNLNIPASGTKTIDVVGNIKSGSNAGPWTVQVDDATGGTGLSTGNSTTIGSDVTLQTITLGNGTITVAEGVSPDDANVVAGSSEVKVGSFKFTAQYTNWTVQEVVVKVPNGASTSVSSVILKYKDSTGTTQTTSGALTLPTAGNHTHATATFTGLTFFVPQNTEQNLDVYVSVPTIASGATTGRGITVLIDENEGFKAVDSAGNTDTDPSSSDLNSAGTSGKGTQYVRKSIPTFSAVALDSSVLAAGTDKVIARFKIAADSAGDIGWKYLSFTMAKSDALALGATTTVEIYEGSNALAGTWATTTAGSTVGAGTMEMFPVSGSSDTSGNMVFEATSEQQVAAGTSVTYEVRTTIGALAASTYNFVSMQIANPTTSVTAGAAYSDVLGNLGDSTPSVIWTDRSSISTVHSESTTDWTNDYLIKTLPLNVGERYLSTS